MFYDFEIKILIILCYHLAVYERFIVVIHVKSCKFTQITNTISRFRA